MKKVIMSIFSALLSLFFLCLPVAAITPDYAEDQVIAAATAGSQTTSGEYTVSPGDPIQYSVSLELPDTAEFISIQPHSSMNFVSGGTLYVMNDKGQVIYTQNLGYTSTDGYFYDLSDMPDPSLRPSRRLTQSVLRKRPPRGTRGLSPTTASMWREHPSSCTGIRN